MPCPFLKHTDNSLHCSALPVNSRERDLRFVIWICTHEWKRYCPYYTKGLSKPESPIEATATGEKSTLPSIQIRHINRIGGPRAFEADLI